MKVDPLRSLIAQCLPSMMHFALRGRLRQRVWRKMLRYYERGQRPVRVRLHGRPLLLNAGNPYPFILADAPDFNSGLVSAAICLHRLLQRRLRVVDVGAAIGDTVALLDASLPRCVESYVCVDGAEENRPLFEANTRGIAGVSVHFEMLSATGGEVSSLHRQHPGTAMATGVGRVRSRTLDALLSESGVPGRCDLLKIDVDGYDGEVLRGAGETLSLRHPMVIFEWHPHLMELCGTDHRAPFQALAAAGYRRLLWFGNRGPFSHISTVSAEAEIDWWRNFLTARNKPKGPHFDIVALPPVLEGLADSIAQAAVYPP